MMNNEYLPPEWQDEERIRVLMGPMPSTKDSIAFNSRVTFWTAALFNWCKVKEVLTFTLYDGQMAFRRGTQVPHCLPQIFQHLIKKGNIITVEDLLKPLDKMESWLAWSKKLIVTPPLWAWTMLQDTVGWKGLDGKVFINQKMLEDRGEELLRIYWRMPESSLSFNPEDVITVKDLYRCTRTPSSLRLEDLNLVLHYLAKKRRIVIREHQGESLVKLAKPGQIEPVVINDIEVAEHELRSSEAKLKERLDTLQRESLELRAGAKKSLVLGLKSEAMSCLRKKKRSEKSIEATLIVLENISLCLQQIQEVKLNVKILNTFQLGVNALKSSITKSGGTDQVSKEMDSLQEVLDECKDITDSLAFGIHSPENPDETDLERELEELIGIGSRNHIEVPAPVESEASTLPNVPRTEPLKKYWAKEVEIT